MGAWHENLQTIIIYARLVIYPFLAYSLIMYAYGPLYRRDKELSKILVVISVAFTLLWGASIIYSITRNNELVVMYNSIGLVPWLFFTLIYLWVRLCSESKEQRRIDANQTS